MIDDIYLFERVLGNINLLTVQNSGYSGTPLAKKLGMKDGSRVLLLHAPENYFDLFTQLPAVTFLKPGPAKADIIHYFVTREKDLIRHISMLRQRIHEDGMIWISWPKKASKVQTDITEDVIRHHALDNGLVDIKVCAVNEVWSGLKLVIPVKSRK